VRFITTDLDVESQSDLTLLVEAFERAGLFALVPPGQDTVQSATFEVPLNAELSDEVADLVSAIDGLNGEALHLWKEATKVFNFGFERTGSEFAVGAVVSHPVVEMIALRGASVAVTIYNAAD
jgi:hypothetical protein